MLTHANHTQPRPLMLITHSLGHGAGAGVCTCRYPDCTRPCSTPLHLYLTCTRVFSGSSSPKFGLLTCTRCSDWTAVELTELNSEFREYCV